jgi:putative SOS response-associated peptidase YedK
MCGRFTHRYTWADIHRLYRLTSPASNVQPSYNVCPTDTVNVVTSLQDTRILQPMRWGLIPRWWSKPLKDLMRLSTFNARVETVTTKPFFREAFKRTRCIIPASGYYEWQDTPDGKQPHYFTRTDGQVISFAGLWDEWKDRATGETLKSCTMIITEPNAMVAEVHDRMPVSATSQPSHSQNRSSSTSRIAAATDAHARVTLLAISSRRLVVEMSGLPAGNSLRAVSVMPKTVRMPSSHFSRARR